MCQYVLITYNKCITFIQDVNRETVCKGEGGYGNSILSVQFFYESKTVLKRKAH